MRSFVIDIDTKYCKGCSICIAECPKKVFVKSRKRNASGYALPEASQPTDCVGCRRCERVCPDGAIDVRESGKAAVIK